MPLTHANPNYRPFKAVDTYFFSQKKRSCSRGAEGPHVEGSARLGVPSHHPRSRTSMVTTQVEEAISQVRERPAGQYHTRRDYIREFL